MSSAVEQSPSAAPYTLDSELPHQRHLRKFRDILTKNLVRLGGFSIIAAIALIFIYLISVVLPVFFPADTKLKADYPLPSPAAGDTLFLSIEEQLEVGLRVTAKGQAVFFNAANGTDIENYSIPVPESAQITAVANIDSAEGIIALGFNDGTALFIKHHYHIDYPQDQRRITPHIEYPYGETPLKINPGNSTLQLISAATGNDELVILAYSDEKKISASVFNKETSLFDETVTLEHDSTSLLLNNANRPVGMLIDPELRWAYIATDEDELYVYRIDEDLSFFLNEKFALNPDGGKLTDLKFATGGLSLLSSNDQGHIYQWFQVRNKKGEYKLHKIREFSSGSSSISIIEPEQRRKGFLTINEQQELSVFHTTASRHLLSEPLAGKNIKHAALSPRADAVLLEDAGDRIYLYKIHNEHPEVSWASLWQRVWYESYDEPEYIWQSSAASNDFEPKFSLVPLTFGTIKAAFFAMLIATPMAIMGAIFTAYFMSPLMRGWIKPTIEIMEALPTVILGFLAGLWLAPFTEAHLPGILSILLLLPPAVLFFAYLWSRLPVEIRLFVPEGWQAALLVPVTIAVGWACIALSPWLETHFLGGDTRLWLDQALDIKYDQRNALVVGIAMGFAVIPSIFSITEDAIFNVPKHLTNASLAMGATQWQTMTRVILPTASPAIFSAVMIGLGRAVGETMIVLMATGNTPILDLNIFEGMRTLSANIAVELPESEVGSTHYRILFLAALVLFMMTFAFNTLAEVIRQSLRDKYSKL